MGSYQGNYPDPPGCLTDIISTPFNKHETMELTLMQEHRFAFYYWAKWNREKQFTIPPSLISIDWHQDLSPPYADEKKGLKALDLSNPPKIANYTWHKLSAHNDVQIHAAVLRNQLKDVYMICRQMTSRPTAYSVKDFYGNLHNVRIFKSFEELQGFLPLIDDAHLYFDIDLDYFTLSNPYSLGCPYRKNAFTFQSRKEIESAFCISNPVIRFVFERMVGLTIATEPKFCGGLKRSNYFLGIIDSLYFYPSLFYTNPNSMGIEWSFNITNNTDE